MNAQNIFIESTIVHHLKMTRVYPKNNWVGYASSLRVHHSDSFRLILETHAKYKYILSSSSAEREKYIFLTPYENIFETAYFTEKSEINIF